MLLDEASEAIGQVVAADHKDQLHAVFDDELPRSFERQLGLIHRVEGHELEHMTPATDFESAGCVDAFDPNLAAVETRAAQARRGPLSGAKKPIFTTVSDSSVKLRIATDRAEPTGLRCLAISARHWIVSHTQPPRSIVLNL